MSRPKTSWPGILPLVLWCMDRTAKAAPPTITTHGSASSTYTFCRLYVRTRFPINLCIISMMVPTCGFLGEYGLVLIPYWFYIKLHSNFSPRNSPPWSYTISTIHGYLTSYTVSTKFAITITFLLLYWVISNHPVSGSIIVTGLKIIGSFPSIRIL